MLYNSSAVISWDISSYSCSDKVCPSIYLNSLNNCSITCSSLSLENSEVKDLDSSNNSTYLNNIGWAKKNEDNCTLVPSDKVSWSNCLKVNCINTGIV